MEDEASPSNWRPVVAYAALSGANQMLWLTYTPVTTDAARHYGVSTGAIGWLAEIFPLLYVVLALPTGRLIDRRMPFWLGLGAALTAAGGLLRLVGDAYWPVLGGQALVAVAQPFVLNAVTRVSRSYLREGDRARGIAVSSAGVFGGMLLALLLGAAFGGSHVPALVAVEGVVSAVCAIALCLALRHPGRRAEPDAAVALVPLGQLWSDRYVRLLVALVCVGFGVFIALTTWLQALLEPAGVSETRAGLLLLVMVVAGVTGSATMPPVLARRAAEYRFILLSVAGTGGGLLVLAAWPGPGSGLAVLAVVGFLLLTDLPVALELAERRAGAAGGTASALIWLAGNAAGLVAALLVQLLLHHPAAAFVVMAVLNLAGVPLLLALRRVAGGPDRRMPAVSTEKV